MLIAALAIVAVPFRGGGAIRTLGVVALMAVSLITPQVMTPVAAPVVTASFWQPFDRGEIPKLVAEGKTVFVDVTADWCLTCKANKKLVLEYKLNEELHNRLRNKLNSSMAIPKWLVISGFSIVVFLLFSIGFNIYQSNEIEVVKTEFFENGANHASKK